MTSRQSVKKESRQQKIYKTEDTTFTCQQDVHGTDCLNVRNIPEHSPLPLLQAFEDSIIVKFVPKQDLPSKTYIHRVERAAREALFSVDAISCI